MFKSGVFLILFLCVPVFFAVENIAEGQDSEFHHFFLRQFPVKTTGYKNIFKEDPRFAMTLLSKDMFFYDPLRKDEMGQYLYLEDLNTEYERWMLDAELDYREIIPEAKYYYDTISRSYRRIMVMLFGTPWLPETKVAIYTMKSLYENYSRLEMNRLSMIEQARKWFKKKTTTGTIAKSIAELQAIENFYGRNPSAYEQERRGLYSFSTGSMLFFVADPLHIFNLVSQIYELMAEIRFKQDVIFSFVSIGSESADIQSFMKDVEIPFPILDDYNMEVSDHFVTGRIPIMTIVYNNNVYCEENSPTSFKPVQEFIPFDFEKCQDKKLYSTSKIAYQGDPLSYPEAKKLLDRLQFEIFERDGQEIQEYYYKKRLSAYYEKIEAEDRKKREEEAQERLEQQEREKAKKNRYLGNR